MPASNQEYWIGKIEKNKKRDRAVIEEISSLGWDFSIIWECQLEEGVDNLLSELETIRSEIEEPT